MRFLKLITGHHRSLSRVIGRRYFAAAATPTEEHDKRNYANNVSEYNTVIDSISAQRRYFLLRDVYDDMALDGVQPNRDTFHSLVIASLKGGRMQDALFFTDQMKAIGLVPDVDLFNILISLCGKSKNSDRAIQFLDEMKVLEVKPVVQTYVCLLNACAAAGRLDRVYAIIRDMTTAGLGLNKYCYAGLITAYKNKTPVPEDFATKFLFKIIEFVERSKEWTSVEGSDVSAENLMMGVLPEELYNLPTAEYAHRRLGFVVKQLTAYHAAFHACAELKKVELMETLLEMLEKDGKTPDTFIVMQIMRCYLHSGDIDRGLKVFEDHMKSDKPPIGELYTTLIEGAMIGYTPRGMQIAQDALTGGYSVANYIWDLMQSRKQIPFLPAVEAYYKGLKEREIPEDEPRLVLASRTYEDLRARFGNIGRAPPS
ncbi:hypothetical protein L484_002511 [Morus notabilis]|uniref:PROP1-like PPR domain-containing protein n=1 Tax=Morus notabilis TaxID=981085 RepID=W9QHH8_9ROSA|nr:hypothetical protein L484_002511 [Morus notabilis]